LPDLILKTTVCDWNAAGSAVVSLEGILPTGSTYAIYNAQAL
jgi:hypothetical protein